MYYTDITQNLNKILIFYSHRFTAYILFTVSSNISLKKYIIYNSMSMVHSPSNYARHVADTHINEYFFKSKIHSYVRFEMNTVLHNSLLIGNKDFDHVV